MIKTFECMLRETGEIDYVFVSDTTDAVRVFEDILKNKSGEYMYLATLNTKGIITGITEVSHGDLAATSMHPRDVLKRALLLNAAGIIICHNHPSGDPTPSNEDIVGTKRLLDACKVLGIKLIDHIIMTNDGKFTSLKKEMNF